MMTPPSYRIAAFLASGELERLFAGLSALVSAAADGRPCAALASFGALGWLLEEDLRQSALDPELTPSLSLGGRETFARSLVELRETAAVLEDPRLYACSASVETMSVTPAEIGERLDGVVSTPRFLREVEGAQLFFV